MTSPNELNAKFKELVAASGDTVQQKVLDAMVDKEINRRADILAKLLEKSITVERELRKIEKPDVLTYNQDGTVASATFSKTAIDAVNKQKKLLEDINAAWKDAVENGNFEKAEKLSSGGDKGNQQKSE